MPATLLRLDCMKGRQIVAVGVIGFVLAAAGLAYAFRAPQREDVVDLSARIWLPSPAVGQLHEVNGLVDAPALATTGQIDGVRPTDVVQNVEHVVLVDGPAGTAVVIDTATLARSAALPVPGGEQVAGDGTDLFALHRGGTNVARLDAGTLSAGPASTVAPIQDWTTAHGHLWILVADGVVTMTGDEPHTVDVPGAARIVASRDGVAVLDTDGVVHFVRDSEVRRRVPVGRTGAFAAGDHTDTIAVLDAAGTLSVHDPDRPDGSTTRSIGTGSDAVPYLSADTVYAVDGAELVVAAKDAAVARSRIGEGPVTVLRSDGFLWANTRGADAVAIHAGEAHHLIKYPAPTTAPPATTPPPFATTPPQTTTRRPTPTRRPETTRTPTRAPTETKTQTKTPGPATSTVSPADPTAACNGRSTKISVANRTETGANPIITVRVCTAPQPGHEYWIVDQNADGGRWWAKRQITRSGTYTVTLREGALPGSKRTFWIVDAHGAGVQWIHDLARDDTGSGGASLPSTVKRVSNGVETTR
jgi:hypothetical protein